LFSLSGFQYCDLLLSGAEQAAWRGMLNLRSEISNSEFQKACASVAERATQTLAWVTPQNWLLDIALDHLTVGRAALYGVLLSASQISDLKSEIANPKSNLATARQHLTAAVDGLRQAGQVHELPRGLLTRAWLRFLEDDVPGCREDLEEAWEIAQRGPMPLFQADIQLTRARLFRDPAALAAARDLIHRHGYHRRDGELADAEAAFGPANC
jgi:hypothetical protein